MANNPDFKNKVTDISNKTLPPQENGQLGPVGITSTIFMMKKVGGHLLGQVPGNIQVNKDICKWMTDSQLLNSNGNIQDGIFFENGKTSIAENIRTYNQGVFLTGLVNIR